MTLANAVVSANGLELGDYTRAAVIFAASVAIALGIRRLLQRLLEREGSERLSAQVAGRFIGYLVIGLGLAYSLHTLDITIGPLLGALGIGGLALALASQDILSNAIDGLLLEVRRPFRRGDQVQTLDYEGVIEDVNLRTVVIRTFDGYRVYVPNTTVFRSPIVNYSRGIRRSTIELGLAYDTDLTYAKELAMQVCLDTDDVLSTPPPEAWITEFDDSTIRLTVRYWHTPENNAVWRLRDAVSIALHTTYREAGIEIAFPQSVVHFTNGQASARRTSSRASNG